MTIDQRWVDWRIRQPKNQGEVAFTIFQNLDNGFYEIHRNASTPRRQGTFSCGYKPVAWLPMPELPDKYKKFNEKIIERRKQDV